MNNDVLGRLTRGELVWWKPSQYRETFDITTRTEFYMCYQGEARALVPKIRTMKDGLPLQEINIETHESNKVDFITLTYSLERVEDPDPDNPDNPDDPTFEFEGKESDFKVGITAEPISQAPVFRDAVNSLDNATLTDLCALMGGQLMDEKGVKLTDKLQGKVPPLLLTKILRGQTSYNAPTYQCTLTIPSKVTITDEGKISTRAGLPSLPDGMTWLCVGSGVTRRNGRTVTQVAYLGGNWDSDIYTK